MLGIFLVIAGAAQYLIRHESDLSRRYRTQSILTISACVMIAGFALVTASKAHAWNDPVEFWSEIVQNLPPNMEAERHPSAQALTNLGIALRDRNKYPEAISCFERSLEIRPDAPLTHANLAFVYARTGKTGEAEELFKKAVSRFPDSSVVRRNLRYLPTFTEQA